MGSILPKQLLAGESMGPNEIEAQLVELSVKLTALAALVGGLFGHLRLMGMMNEASREGIYASVGSVSDDLKRTGAINALPWTEIIEFVRSTDESAKASSASPDE